MARKDGKGQTHRQQFQAREEQHHGRALQEEKYTDKQRHRTQPVALQIGKLVGRQRDLEREVGNEDDPDYGADRFEKRAQAPNQFDYKQPEPHCTEHEHRHFEPALDPLELLRACAALRPRLRRRGWARGRGGSRG